jgi:2-C-methyl-D-erythritol 4-phosphate cytidylyltransferase
VVFKKQESNKRSKIIMAQKINVILSGGSGSRLWPLSKKSRTKQYIPLFEGKSLFEITLTNNQSLCDEVIVVGNIDNYQLSLNALQEKAASKFQIIVEAMPKTQQLQLLLQHFQYKRMICCLLHLQTTLLKIKRLIKMRLKKLLIWLRRYF